MTYAVLGTGMVARSIAGRLHELGHAVALGTRDPAATLARTEPDAMGAGPISAWLDEHPGARLETFADAAASAELVINATNGAGALAALELAAGDAGAGLDTKVVVDVCNPLDFSAGFPPTLLVKDTDSLGEQIQRTFPQARVVKALNTLNADLMAHPGVLGTDTTVFVSGNDADAKATVRALLESFGHGDVVDLGDITTARGTEMYLPLWLRLMGSLGTATFNIKVVR